MKNYDVIIVGAGPGGIFTALELVKLNSGLKMLLIDKGGDIEHRSCPAIIKNRPCAEFNCNLCGLLCGWGGAGAFSDGKLNLSTQIGGSLNQYFDEEKLSELIKYVDDLYVSYGAPTEVYGTNEKRVQKFIDAAIKYDLKLVPSKIRHLGSDRSIPFLKGIYEVLNEKIDIKLRTEIDEVIVRDKKAIGVKTAKGEEIFAEYIILAPGRVGASWLEKEAKRLKLATINNPVDIGVRVEVPATVLKELTDATYEAKLIYYSKKFDDQVRTFCMNPYGEVVKEFNHGIATVNGHSYAEKKLENTNFAILVSTFFTEPFHEPIAYGEYIARLANLISGGIIVQRLGDLKMGKRSTPERIKRGLVNPSLKDATPGDLSFAIPYRCLSDILEMLEAMDNIAPGVNSRHTLLYGLEVKFYSMRIKLTNSLETEVPNLFAVGDGAGVSRGLIQASASGVAAAREIKKRLGDIK
ncbi:MAG: NAD(P)/FAD-dependent oxidoreductase [Nitrospirae bacterium]|nr:NAD(P)/FAD-dependent oxidoreductase [Nitrospirota bacterium]